MATGLVSGISTRAPDEAPRIINLQQRRAPRQGQRGLLCRPSLCTAGGAPSALSRLRSSGRRGGKGTEISPSWVSHAYPPSGEESPMDSHCESEAEETASNPMMSDVTAADLRSTRELVEVAMLAAMTGLAYFLASIIKLEGYLGYFLPLPPVLASLRWGPLAGARVVVATCCLIAVLLGPVRMLTYLFMHGIVASILSFTWGASTPWPMRIILCAAGRATGLVLYICISCWTLNENLFAVILNGIFNLLDQFLATAGSSLIPSMGFVAGIFSTLLVINNLVYISLLSVLYAIILRGMGYEVDLPARIQRILYPQGPPPLPGRSF